MRQLSRPDFATVLGLYKSSAWYPTVHTIDHDSLVFHTQKLQIRLHEPKVDTRAWV